MTRLRVGREPPCGNGVPPGRGHGTGGNHQRQLGEHNNGTCQDPPEGPERAVGPEQVRDTVAKARLAELVIVLDPVARFGLERGLDLTPVPKCPWCGCRGIQVQDSVRLVCGPCGSNATRFQLEGMVLADSNAIAALTELGRARA